MKNSNQERYLLAGKRIFVAGHKGMAGSEVIIESPQATSTCGCGVSVTFEV